MKKKKRFLCMALIVVLVMSITSTAFASYYQGSCINNYRTDGTVELVNYVRDDNTRCYFCPSATEYNTGYQSTAWKVGESDYFSTWDMNSGGLHTHYYPNRPTSGTGYLRFYNTCQPGNYIYSYGYMT